MDVKLDKQSKIPVYLQIVDQLRAQIMCGALPSGSVLPSERGLAQMLEVHRNTVVKAYGELKSDAWIESRQGIGYVVPCLQFSKSQLCTVRKDGLRQAEPPRELDQ